MYCQQCNHSLAQAIDQRCSECGRVFCPTDPGTYREGNSWIPHSRPDRIGKIGWLALCLAQVPMLHVVTLLIFWMLVTPTNGNTMENIPKAETDSLILVMLSHAFGYASFFSLVLSPVAFIISMLLLAVNLYRCFEDPARYHKYRVVLSFIGISLLLAVIGMLILSSLSIHDWFWS